MINLRTLCSILIFNALMEITESSKILAIYPMPSISHQMVFRKLTLELVKQGHEVTVITPDPAYKKDLKNFLDSSKHGVIYVSFGTNALSNLLPEDKVKIMTKVLGQLPYDVLWKWDSDELPGRINNMKLSKWLPQADLLRHPKIKLFITQGGLQSIDEAITAGVPLLAFPVLGDQWYNAEKCVRHGIGKKILFEEVTEDLLKKAIEKVIEDESYSKNIIRIREVMQDRPQPPLDLAMFWINYLIRHKGGQHLRASGANLTWAQYYEIELVLILIMHMLVLLVLISFSVYYIYRPRGIITKKVKQR